jgi:glutathione synthase/RimK-type ligase-like ATP-grasp enzyme
MSDVADVVMYWLRTRRTASVDRGLAGVIEHCRRAAAANGMELRHVSVDDIMVAASSGGVSVTIGGVPVDRATTFFHTKLMTWPETEKDTWRFVSTADLLAAAGFHTTVPTDVNVATNDKLLTLVTYALDDFPWVPSIRVSTRGFSKLDTGAVKVEFPAIVKPANWGGGYGIHKVSSYSELEATLQLAGGGEITMVVQPWLGEKVADNRVYCVDGVAVAATRRVAADGAIVGNLHQGGRLSVIDVPDELRAPAHRIAGAVGLPYVCIDFLEAGGSYYLSEIEVDGGTSGNEELGAQRFGAYRRAFERARAAWTAQPCRSPMLSAGR